MKLFSLIPGLLLFAAQAILSNDYTEKMILQNDHVKVTEYTSSPQEEVCGKGTHRHGPHLTVILTEATVQVTGPDGKTVEQKVPAGTTFWSEAETHQVKNSGKGVLKVQLIEVASAAVKSAM
jgi:hypothetical protein